MSTRSIIIGVLGVVFISAFCYFFDGVIGQGLFISSLMPVAVYGTLILFLLTLYPLLCRFGKGVCLSGRELAVIVCLILLACGIPGRGLVQYLPPAAMFPHHDNRVRPGWASEDVLAIAPPQMLADIKGNEDRALDGYLTGLSVGDRRISPLDVPWSAWGRTLVFWVPIMLTATLALLGLAAVFHKQWVHHEQLPYPITTFTQALLPDENGRLAFLGNRLFWIGFLLVFGIQFNNYLLKWLPDFLIPIKTSFDFSAFASLAPALTKGNGMTLFQPCIIFPVLGLAYFLSADVSFTMTVTPFAFALIYGLFEMHGVAFGGTRMLGPNIQQSIFAGGYFAIVLMVMYTGRHYYVNVLRSSLALRPREGTDSYAVWGMRAFLACTLLFIIQLVVAGLDWQLAIVYTFLAFMVHVVVSRLIAETGCFMVGTYVYPCVMIWAFCGTTALGPQSLLIMFLVSTILVSGPGWAPMPFFVQALKLGDLYQVDLKRLLKWGAMLVVLSLLIALPCTIYWQYQCGAPTTGSPTTSWTRRTASFPFENMVEIKQRLRAQGLLETAESLHGWSRFAHLAPDGKQVSAFLIAMTVALIFSLARLRFAWWPLHPMAFVFLGGFPAYYLWFSFMLAWLTKLAVTKYGGAKLYEQLKPLMIGFIAGGVLGGLLPMLVGSAYYFTVGHPP
ncbi:MAG: hypothetical protein A3K19_04085 [Lentisphaerae bacterium RIFOXYB12_FULL_65_16]|nr:MAG: hypothetical protein A3K18_08300 [Lentisphaerae bacterium RIFOXYA12_64_32]OGV84265.1 MAG: hypothetical protein A3K19_04085 [Lentisphaerae bacterium RIFOXYB12_FULL_65_16]